MFVNIQPEIVEYEETLENSTFKLIIGTKTMEEIGIILNFVDKVITIDSIVLPMQRINELPKSNNEHWASTIL